MKLGRPDVACFASRKFPRDPGITKAKWMEILDEDTTKASRHYQKSVSLHEFSNLAHSTWSHFTYGDPVGSFKVDRGLYGDAEARRRHLARAQRSGERWRARKAPSSPLPQEAESYWTPTPASSSRDQQVPEIADNESPGRPPSVAEVSQNAPPSGRSKPSTTPLAANSPTNPSPQADTRRPPPPALPQLWAVQPRIMTPHSPYEPSSKRSFSVTPSTVMSHTHDTSTRLPLRRVDSEPGSWIGMRVESNRGSQKGYLDPSLKIGPSPPASMKSSNSGCRYTSTFKFG